MRFTVTWSPAADAQLFDLWIKNPDRRTGLTDASDQVGRLLRDDPQSKGRPFGRSRILIEPPIVLLYSVLEADRMVKVLSVRLL